jgi:hypothetical protein
MERRREDEWIYGRKSGFFFLVEGRKEGATERRELKKGI